MSLIAWLLLFLSSVTSVLSTVSESSGSRGPFGQLILEGTGKRDCVDIQKLNGNWNVKIEVPDVIATNFKGYDIFGGTLVIRKVNSNMRAIYVDVHRNSSVVVPLPKSFTDASEVSWKFYFDHRKPRL